MKTTTQRTELQLLQWRIAGLESMRGVLWDGVNAMTAGMRESRHAWAIDPRDHLHAEIAGLDKKIDALIAELPFADDGGA